MHIGITYDLKQDYLALGLTSEQVAEFDRVETIDAIEAVLTGAGHQVTRIGSAPRLVEELGAGRRWDLVFNIAEGAHGAARESQVPAILDVFGIEYTFSDPQILAVCLDKRLAKHVIREHSLPTPDFRVITHPAAASSVTLPFPVFAKPIAEGTSRGITAQSIAHDRTELGRVSERLLETYRQPVLVERYLPGREFTVGVVGTGGRARALGALEVCTHGEADVGVYSYDNKQLFEGRVRYHVATDAEAERAVALALDAYLALGCRDGGRVDVRSDDNGQPCFIEANPLAGLHPEISDLAILARLTGLAYPALILQFVASAASRLNGARPSSNAVGAQGALSSHTAPSLRGASSPGAEPRGR
jgi:D-alanine-D-alanine ligase